ncbi:tol-pal system protein YbgF [bacterium]|nr:tol-pal system protein YbgF [bacterium]
MRKRTLTYIAVAMLAAVLFSGCATRGEIKRFQQQMDYLVQSNAKQQQQLDRLDSLLTEQQETLRQMKATQDYNLQMLVEEMKIVENLLSESGYQVSELREKLAAMEQELASVPPATQKSVSDTADTSSAQAAVNPKKLFETAQLDFNRSKFELARMEFEQFLTLFPKSALADDAQYYIGECLYALGKYSDAQKAYLKVKQNYPESELVPSALYSAGICAMKMDDINGARRFFTEIVENYPTAEEAAPAREKLKMLGE